MKLETKRKLARLIDKLYVYTITIVALVMLVALIGYGFYRLAVNANRTQQAYKEKAEQTFMYWCQRANLSKEQCDFELYKINHH